MMKVWTDNAEAGLFDRNGERGSTFAYLPNLLAERAVSVTLPVRLASWSLHYGLPPIFEMNLPEGYLRERLRLAFAKATGTEFSRSAQVNEDAERLFLLIALNCALRNGDAVRAWFRPAHRHTSRLRSGDDHRLPERGPASTYAQRFD